MLRDERFDLPCEALLGLDHAVDAFESLLDFGHEVGEAGGGFHGVVSDLHGALSGLRAGVAADSSGVGGRLAHGEAAAEAGVLRLAVLGGAEKGDGLVCAGGGCGEAHEGVGGRLLLLLVCGAAEHAT